MESWKYLLVPLLMLSDYILTVAGARLADKTYRTHFKFPDYELNPLFRKDIAQKRWFNQRHLAFVALTTLVCVFWPFIFSGIELLSEGLFGYLITSFASLNGHHISNILVFRRLQKHPEDISGEIRMTQNYLLTASRYRTFGLLLPLAFAASLAPSAFLFGAVASQVALILIKYLWAGKGRTSISAGKNLADNNAVVSTPPASTGPKTPAGG